MLTNTIQNSPFTMNATQVGDEYTTCPFNKSHKVFEHHFCTHIENCMRKFLDMNLGKCSYNSTHVSPKDEYQIHLETCKYRWRLDKDGIALNKDKIDKYLIRHKKIDTSKINTIF